MLTYICKYTPIELLKAMGAEPEMPNEDAPDFALTDEVIHSSVCSHAKMFIYELMKDREYYSSENGGFHDRTEENRTVPAGMRESGKEASANVRNNQITKENRNDRNAVRNRQELILTNCCDSIRRVYDTVHPQNFTFRMMLDLPHRTEGFAVDLYARELQRLVRAWEEYSGRSFDRQILIREWKKSADVWKSLVAETDDNSGVNVHSDLQKEAIVKAGLRSAEDAKSEIESSEVQRGTIDSGEGNNIKAQKRFIAVFGARPSDELMKKIQDTLPFPAVNLTCGGLRSLPEPPEEFLNDGKEEPGYLSVETVPAGERFENDADVSLSNTGTSAVGYKNDDVSNDAAGATEEKGTADKYTGDSGRVLKAYAQALLAQVPCMRMEDPGERRKLLCSRNLAGIVYHSVRFCDYYSFEYAQIRRESDLPILKIESDYTSQSEGQLSTRLEAFGESLRAMYHMEKDVKEQNDTEVSPIETPVYIGIDSGSTTTNGAAIDEEGHLLASSIVRTGARAGNAAQKVLEDLKRQLGLMNGDEQGGYSHLSAGESNPAKLGKKENDNTERRNDYRIVRIVATGYGREHIDFADEVRTEISCHARGAHFTNPAARTIIDIGGQDSKVICLDENGNVTNFVMNDKCAAGTGRFLEMMAHTLELDLDEMAGMGLTWKKDLTITSTCTVFAESEVVSLIAENSDTDDIIHALNKSVAKKTRAMVRRVQGAGPYMMTGGVARNQGVVKELERDLGAPIAVLDHPDLNGAIGAALYALDKR